MDLNHKIAAAMRNGGVFGALTDNEAVTLTARGHAKPVETTGRWVLTDVGWAAAGDLAAADGMR